MDSYLSYQNPTTVDKKLDSERVTVGENEVERERVQLAGALAAAIAAVLNAHPSATAYGLVTREVIPTSIVSGRNVLSTDAEPLVGSATPCRKVIITADSDNDDYVVVGDANIDPAAETRRGIILGASASAVIDIDDVNKIYVAAKTAGDGVSFIYLV